MLSTQPALPDFLRELGKTNLTPGGLIMAERAFAFVAQAQHKNIAALGYPTGLPAHVTVLQDSQATTGRPYAAAIIQGLLSFDDDAIKRKRLDVLRESLMPGGHIVLHEFVWRQLPPRELLDEIPSVWGMPFHPLTTRGWWDMLDAAGFTGIQSSIGTWGWFRPAALHRDEGEDEAAEMMLSVLMDDTLRDRYLRALDHAERYARFYGSIVLSAHCPRSPSLLVCENSLPSSTS